MENLTTVLVNHWISTIRKEEQLWMEKCFSSHVPPVIIQYIKAKKHTQFLIRYFERHEFRLQFYPDGKIIAMKQDKIIGAFKANIK